MFGLSVAVVLIQLETLEDISHKGFESIAGYASIEKSLFLWIVYVLPFRCLLQILSLFVNMCSRIHCLLHLKIEILGYVHLIWKQIIFISKLNMWYYHLKIEL